MQVDHTKQILRAPLQADVSSLTVNIKLTALTRQQCLVLCSTQVPSSSLGALLPPIPPEK